MNVPVPPALRWSSVRLVLGVLVVLVASAMWLCGALLVPALEARMQERWQVYQSREADLWARMLAARLETPQRLLATLAEGWQVSPAHALAVPQQRQVARLRGLESLHWALPTGEVRHYPVQAEADDLDSQGVDALRAMAGPRYEQYSMQVAAAANGLGVALMPTLLIEAELASGSLVVASAHPVLSRRSYYLVQPDLPERPALTLFKAWLLGHVEN